MGTILLTAAVVTIAINQYRTARTIQRIVAQNAAEEAAGAAIVRESEGGDHD